MREPGALQLQPSHPSRFDFSVVLPLHGVASQGLNRVVALAHVLLVPQPVEPNESPHANQRMARSCAR